MMYVLVSTYYNTTREGIWLSVKISDLAIRIGEHRDLIS